MLLGFIGICAGVVLQSEIALVVGAVALCAPIALNK
jgi:hypothetical protein